MAALAHAAGLCPGGAWGDARYALTLLLPPEVALQRCWADTDSLLGGVADWSAQPIPLRHPFCFYYGHVAAFAKLKMLPQVGGWWWAAWVGLGLPGWDSGEAIEWLAG